VLVNYAKTYFTTAIPEVWNYALGALFVLVTLFLPRGIVGLWSRAVEFAYLRGFRRERQAAIQHFRMEGDKLEVTRE
jgi:hypothetical protein